jgi:hypothetical protein
VDCIDPTTGKDTFQKMLVACKRYARSCKAFVNPNINKGYSGQLVDMCAKMSLSAQRHELGVDFTPDSPYLVPGFLALEDSKNEAGGLCLLFTTFHLALNYVRAAHWFQGQVTLAFDHTFKMDMKGRPHFTINVMVRHATTPPPPSVPVCQCVRHVLLRSRLCLLAMRCTSSVVHSVWFTACVVNVHNEFSVFVVTG